MDLNWDQEFALKQLGGNIELLRKCISFYLRAAKEDVQRIETGIIHEDFEAVQSSAHSLKGASANIGMEGIRMCAFKIEEAAIYGDLQLLTDKTIELKKMLDQLTMMVIE